MQCAQVFGTGNVLEAMIHVGLSRLRSRAWWCPCLSVVLGVSRCHDRPGFNVQERAAGSLRVLKPFSDALL